MAEGNELTRLLLLIVAILVLLPILVMVFAWPMMGMWGGGHMWNGGMWNGSGVPGIWLVMWLVLLLILFGGGYLLYRMLTRSDRDTTDAALEELRIAYARGELSDEQFEKRRERLRREEDT
jgi:putative membrane protein